MSDASRGKKVLTSQQFREFASILEFSAAELVKNAGSTKKRHAHFHRLLTEMGRFTSKEKQRAVKQADSSISRTKKNRVQESVSELDENLQLGALMGDILESEDFTLGHLLD